MSGDELRGDALGESKTERGGGELMVGVVYLVPVGRGSAAVCKTEYRIGIEKLTCARGLTRFLKEGKRVWIVGDVNGRIGEIDGMLEVMVGQETEVVRFKRVSDDNIIRW